MPTRPDQEAAHELSLLNDAWDKALQHWRDDASRQFAAQVWGPLADESRACLEALRTLLNALDSAERETEY
jgi:hypothetical protein